MLFQFTSENSLLEVELFNQLFHSPDITSQNHIEKQPSIRLTLQKTKIIFGKTLLSGTHCQIVGSVFRTVLDYWIALCKPKSDVEANKR